MKDVKIRFAKKEDSAHLEILDKQARSEIKWWEIQTKEEFHKSIKNNPFLTVVACKELALLGYLQGTLKFENTAVWIEDVFVNKKYRKNDIAKRLVNKFVKYWKDKRKAIVLITSDRNVKIFNKIGFQKRANYMVYKP